MNVEITIRGSNYIDRKYFRKFCKATKLEYEYDWLRDLFVIKIRKTQLSLIKELSEFLS